MKEQCHVIYSVPENMDTEERMRFSGRTASMAGTKNAMFFKAKVGEYVRPSVRVTTINRLSSGWKLNGNRALNGGLSIL